MYSKEFVTDVYNAYRRNESIKLTSEIFSIPAAHVQAIIREKKEAKAVKDRAYTEWYDKYKKK